ncbi:hypothetical protein G6F63_016041 [Rhizopus arrhizus]|nr:hypothetical protein G6F63_016041 [Rhizopus arrhizus]
MRAAEQGLGGPRRGVHRAGGAQHVFLGAVAGGAVAAAHADPGLLVVEHRIDEAPAGTRLVGVLDFLEGGGGGPVQEQAGDELRAAAA